MKHRDSHLFCEIAEMDQVLSSEGYLLIALQNSVIESISVSKNSDKLKKAKMKLSLPKSLKRTRPLRTREEMEKRFAHSRIVTVKDQDATE